MDLETLIAVVSACGFAFSQFLSALFMFKQRRSNKKLKTDYIDLLNLSKKQQIVIGIPADINAAESKIGEKNGFVKESIVLNAAQKNCLDAGIPFDSDFYRGYIKYFMSTPQAKDLKKESDTNGEKSEII